MIDLKVMADYAKNVPVWGDSDVWPEGIEEAELASLGVSDALTQKLRTWQREWERRAWRGEPQGEYDNGAQVSRALAHELQAELPDCRILLFDSREGRVVSDW